MCSCTVATGGQIGRSPRRKNKKLIHLLNMRLTVAVSTPNTNARSSSSLPRHRRLRVIGSSSSGDSTAFLPAPGQFKHPSASFLADFWLIKFPGSDCRSFHKMSQYFLDRPVRNCSCRPPSAPATFLKQATPSLTPPPSHAGPQSPSLALRALPSFFPPAAEHELPRRQEQRRPRDSTATRSFSVPLS